MSLPILQPRRHPSHADLLRLFYQAESRWCEHLAEPEPLDVGTAFCNPKLSHVPEANCIRDASLPADSTPQAAVDAVNAFFAERNAHCAAWAMNTSAASDRTQPLSDHLLAHGHRAVPAEILLLEPPPQPMNEAGGLTIIPARAGYAHVTRLFEEASRAHKAQQLAEAAVLHLDDPHWDALLAMKDGQPVAYAGVLAAGEVGRIGQLYVAEPHRRQGIGRTMLSRILEISGRAQFKHVMAATLPDQLAAATLLRSASFHPLGQITRYLA